jgi:serine/threonine protein kinase
MQKRFQVNDLIGEYRVTSFLGEGGMGEVYLGVHEKLGRRAAIKILHAAAADPTFKQRFFNEARLQANLHHPNIATLYDFQEQGDELLIFMEFVDGESLEDLIERRSFSVEESLTAFASLCEAVGYIHQNGVIHRDIKSQNIKLTSSGTVKLLDFGIAKDAASHGLTQAGGVIGTPSYLSPEQLKGEAATPQADVWALGVLLYEMLTGTLPFKGNTLGGLVHKITTGEFTPPENINPAVPRDVANIVRKCLKKDAGARFRSVDELLTVVRSTLDQRQAKDVGATLKQTFGFKPAASAGLASDADTADSVGALPAKISPMVLAAAGGGIVLVMLIAIAGLGFWALSGKTAPASPSVPASQTVANANTTKPSPVAGTRRIRVDIDEGKAQVTRNGQVLGTTPLDLDLAVGEDPSLLLHRDGYEDKTVQIEVGSGKKVFTFSLKPKS